MSEANENKELIRCYKKVIEDYKDLIHFYKDIAREQAEEICRLKNPMIALEEPDLLKGDMG